MTHPLDSVAKVFEFNQMALGATVDGFEEADWLRRWGSTSHTLWIAGHIAAYRRVLLRKTGGTLDEAPWEKLYTIGTKPGDGKDEPPPRDLVEDIQQVGKRLAERLAELTADELAAPHGEAFPTIVQSLEGYVLFMQWHESYHTGQMGLIRRMLGKAGLA